jgi:hypothetical protein
MPDWQTEIARTLAGGNFSAEEREEISRELAGYLEDLCSESRASGADESSVIAHAARDLYQDARLGPKLRRARQENTMNDRTQRFWLPGCIILLASALALALLQLAGFSPYFPRVWAANSSAAPYLHDSFMVYVPWLCILPFLGAAGAYWSRRAGSGPALRIAVGIFPAFVFLGTFLVIFAVSFVIDTLPPANVFLPAFAGFILSWVVIPGAALLLGVLPFLGGNSTQRRIA